jgi:hypothetical protein
MALRSIALAWALTLALGFRVKKEVRYKTKGMMGANRSSLREISSVGTKSNKSSNPVLDGGAPQVVGDGEAQPVLRYPAERYTALFRTSDRRISLRGNSEVKLVTDFDEERANEVVVCKALRFYRGEKDPEKLALFAAEAIMANRASLAGIGCPVYYWSVLDTETAMPMIVMKKMEMGCGDAIKAGADPGYLILGLVNLFARLKESKLFWKDVSSPNNIMTDSTIEDFGPHSHWYFIDFGTSTATSASYIEQAEALANDPHLYDQDLASWWFLLATWVNNGIVNKVDGNRTVAGLDPQLYTQEQLTNAIFYQPLTQAEQANLRNFKQYMVAYGLWPEYV